MSRISIVCFLLCWGLSTTLSAQRFAGFLVGGINLSQIDGDGLIGFNQPGFQAGPRVEASLSNRWALSLELLYAQQGSRRTLNAAPGSAIDRIRLNLIEVPVMIQFSDWKFQVGAGLAYGRLINYRVLDVTGADITPLTTYRDNLFSVIIGCTFNVSERLGLNVGWNRNLNNLQADSGAGTFIGRTIQIRGIYALQPRQVVEAP